MIDQKALLEMAEELERGAIEGNPNFFFHHVAHDDGTIVISGDQGALREFAGQILRLIAKPYVQGAHWHFDEAAFSDEGSQPLVVARTEESAPQ